MFCDLFLFFGRTQIQAVKDNIYKVIARDSVTHETEKLGYTRRVSDLRFIGELRKGVII
jgi:hypothetical protein